jgi:hypothetical protein
VNRKSEPDRPSDDQRPPRPRFGVTRVVVVAIVVWFAVSAVSFALDLAHRVLVLLVVAGAALLFLKLSRSSRS